jgi:hypothetical protein
MKLTQTLLWPPNLIRALLNLYLRHHYAEALSRMDWHISEEQKRIAQWPQREQVWRTERARLAMKLDQLRGLGDRVKYLRRSER